MSLSNSKKEFIPIFWNVSFNKGTLKNFVSWCFENYGQRKTIKILEKLQLIGFGYATKAGVSISIDDLQIPPTKSLLLLESDQAIEDGFLTYQKSQLTGLERFQRIIETWHNTSESLKDEMIKNFRKIDILNPVFMMAFSGARGNVSQVRQLVSMRGLMSDPQGKILSFPIRSNFREGLTLTEYVISCYGARKGVVDTALRTANAGYLTRRLVDVAQHVIVLKFDCGTKKGFYLTEMKKFNKTLYPLRQRLLGRVLAANIYRNSSDNLVNTSFSNNKEIIGFRNEEISATLAEKIAKVTNKVFIRSPLTCQTPRLVCQLCYGWSLSEGYLVAIGEAVGVIAAQSIGEPGTQLTMRTFHTGGVFSGEMFDQLIAPYDGFVYYPNSIPGTLIRTTQGKIAFLTKIEGKLSISKNKTVDFMSSTKQSFKLPAYTVLFVRNNETIIKDQLIAELAFISPTIQKTGEIAEFVVKSEMEGQLCSGSVNVLETFTEYNDIMTKSIDWGLVWILSGKICQLPINSAFFALPGDLVNKYSTLSQIKWHAPMRSIVDTNLLVNEISFRNSSLRGFQSKFKIFWNPNENLELAQKYVHKKWLQKTTFHTLNSFFNSKLKLNQKRKKVCFYPLSFIEESKIKGHYLNINAATKKLFLQNFSVEKQNYNSKRPTGINWENPKNLGLQKKINGPHSSFFGSFDLLSKLRQKKTHEKTQFNFGETMVGETAEKMLWKNQISKFSRMEIKQWYKNSLENTSSFSFKDSLVKKNFNLKKNLSFSKKEKINLRLPLIFLPIANICYKKIGYFFLFENKTFLSLQKFQNFGFNYGGETRINSFVVPSNELISTPIFVGGTRNELISTPFIFEMPNLFFKFYQKSFNYRKNNFYYKNSLLHKIVQKKLKNLFFHQNSFKIISNFDSKLSKLNLLQNLRDQRQFSHRGTIVSTTTKGVEINSFLVPPTRITQRVFSISSNEFSQFSRFFMPTSLDETCLNSTDERKLTKKLVKFYSHSKDTNSLFHWFPKRYLTENGGTYCYLITYDFFSHFGEKTYSIKSDLLARIFWVSNFIYSKQQNSNLALDVDYSLVSNLQLKNVNITSLEKSLDYLYIKSYKYQYFNSWFLSLLKSRTKTFFTKKRFKNSFYLNLKHFCFKKGKINSKMPKVFSSNEFTQFKNLAFTNSKEKNVLPDNTDVETIGKYSFGRSTFIYSLLNTKTLKLNYTLFKKTIHSFNEIKDERQFTQTCFSSDFVPLTTLKTLQNGKNVVPSQQTKFLLKDWNNGWVYKPKNLVAAISLHKKFFLPGQIIIDDLIFDNSPIYIECIPEVVNPKIFKLFSEKQLSNFFTNLRLKTGKKSNKFKFFNIKNLVKTRNHRFFKFSNFSVESKKLGKTILSFSQIIISYLSFHIYTVTNAKIKVSKFYSDYFVLVIKPVTEYPLYKPNVYKKMLAKLEKKSIHSFFHYSWSDPSNNKIFSKILQQNYHSSILNKQKQSLKLLDNFPTIDLFLKVKWKGIQKNFLENFIGLSYAQNTLSLKFYLLLNKQKKLLKNNLKKDKRKTFYKFFSLEFESKKSFQLLELILVSAQKTFSNSPKTDDILVFKFFEKNQTNKSFNQVFSLLEQKCYIAQKSLVYTSLPIWKKTTQIFGNSLPIGFLDSLFLPAVFGNIQEISQKSYFRNCHLLTVCFLVKPFEQPLKNLLSSSSNGREVNDERNDDKNNEGVHPSFSNFSPKFLGDGTTIGSLLFPSERSELFSVSPTSPLNFWQTELLPVSTTSLTNIFSEPFSNQKELFSNFSDDFSNLLKQSFTQTLKIDLKILLRIKLTEIYFLFSALFLETKQRKQASQLFLKMDSAKLQHNFKLSNFPFESSFYVTQFDYFFDSFFSLFFFNVKKPKKNSLISFPIVQDFRRKVEATRNESFHNYEKQNEGVNLSFSNEFISTPFNLKFSKISLAKLAFMNSEFFYINCLNQKLPLLFLSSVLNFKQSSMELTFEKNFLNSKLLKNKIKNYCNFSDFENVIPKNRLEGYNFYHYNFKPKFYFNYYQKYPLEYFANRPFNSRKVYNNIDSALESDFLFYKILSIFHNNNSQIRNGESGKTYSFIKKIGINSFVVEKPKNVYGDEHHKSSFKDFHFQQSFPIKQINSFSFISTIFQQPCFEIFLTTELSFGYNQFQHFQFSKNRYNLQMKGLSAQLFFNTKLNQQDIVLTRYLSPFFGEILRHDSKDYWLQNTQRNRYLILTKKNQIAFSLINNFNQQNKFLSSSKFSKKSSFSNQYFSKNQTYLGKIIAQGDYFNFNNQTFGSSSESGIVIHFNNSKITLRKAQSFLLSPNCIFHYSHGDLVEKNKPLLSLPFKQLKTGDIVQGIPKVEQLLEARSSFKGKEEEDNLHKLLNFVFERYKNKFTLKLSVRKSLSFIQLILVNSVQRIYRSQGVSISDKHLEVIVKQMTSKVYITSRGDSSFFRGEHVDLYIVEMWNSLHPNLKQITYKPILLGISRSSLEVNSFLSAASFQHTKKVLSRSAFKTNIDFLNGLKENVIIGNLISAGTGNITVNLK